MLDAEPLEQAPSLFQRLIEKGSAVEVQQVEDHQDHRHLAAQLGRDLLSPEPALELEETQHVSIPVGEDLAVEEDGMPESWRALSQLGERASRLFQVAREQLDPTIVTMELAADAVVLLLGPHLVRAHALESFGGGLDRAREHETDGLEQRHRARLQPAVLDSYSRLADVSRDEVDALHLGDGYAERLGDGGLNEALAQADAHLARDDLDHEPRRFRMKTAQELLERRGLGRPAGCAA